MPSFPSFPLKSSSLIGQIEQERWGEAELYLVTKAGILESTICFDGLNLPIHYVLSNFRNAPLSSIQALLRAFPNSIAKKGRNGMLPLHMAMYYNCPPDIVLHLIRMHPRALDAKDKEGKTPKDYGYDDPNNLLSTPIVCYMTQNQYHAIVQKRDDKFCALLPIYNHIVQKQNKLDTQSAQLEKRYEELVPLVMKEFQKADDSVSSFMDNLMSIQDEIDDFVDKMNGRINALEMLMKERDDDLVEWNREEDRKSVEWHAFADETRGEIENLGQVVKECEKVVNGKLTQDLQMSEEEEAKLNIRGKSGYKPKIQMLQSWKKSMPSEDSLTTE